MGLSCCPSSIARSPRRWWYKRSLRSTRWRSKDCRRCRPSNLHWRDRLVGSGCWPHYRNRYGSRLTAGLPLRGRRLNPRTKALPNVSCCRHVDLISDAKGRQLALYGTSGLMHGRLETKVSSLMTKLTTRRPSLHLEFCRLERLTLSRRGTYVRSAIAGEKA
jgi:hypothetical protein